jgi:hypothetical protein
MHAHGREAAGGLVYERHRPEDTRLYRLVEQHYPAFVEHLAEQGMALPAYVEKEFESYLKCGCVFRAQLDTDSGANWTPIPGETGQRFRRKLDTDSGLKLDSFRGTTGIA